MKQKKNRRGYARIRAAMLRNEAYWLTQVVLDAAEGTKFFNSSFAGSNQTNALDRLVGKGLVRLNRRGFHVPTKEGVQTLRRLLWNIEIPLTLEGA